MDPGMEGGYDWILTGADTLNMNIVVSYSLWERLYANKYPMQLQKQILTVDLIM